VECRRCHFQNLPGTERCVQCGALLVALETLSVVPPRSHQSPRARGFSYALRSFFSWRPLIDRLATLGRAIARVQNESQLLARSLADLGGALVASLVPGLGHWRLGQRRRAALIFWGWLVLLVLGVLQASGWLVASAVSVHVFSVVDILYAHRQTTVWQRFLVSLLLFLVLLVAVYVPAGFLLRQLAFVGWIPENAVELTAEAHRQVLVAFTPLGRRDVGDVVLYRAAGGRFGVAGLRHLAIVVRQGVNVARVLGVAGDTVSFSGGAVRVNGVLTEGSLVQALFGGDRGSGGLDGYEFGVPTGHVFVIPQVIVWPAGAANSLEAAKAVLSNSCVVNEYDILGEGFLVLRPLGSLRVL
jgi:hypothetical protein